MLPDPIYPAWFVSLVSGLLPFAIAAVLHYVVGL